MSEVADIDNAAMDKQNWLMSQYNNPNFIAQVEGMEPAAKEEYIDNLYRSYTGEEGLINEELATADALRSREGPQMRSAGDVTIAANPLEHLAKGLGDYKANGMRDDARAAQEQLNAARQSGTAQTAKHLMAAQRAPEQANAAQGAQQQSQAQTLQAAQAQQALINELQNKR